MDDPTPALRRRLQELPTISSPRSADEVLREARRRRTRRLAGPAAAIVTLAAAVLLVLRSEAPGLRTRGAALAPSVALSAAAEGPLGIRPLASGDALGADEAVVFRITTGGHGVLTLSRADGAPIWPLDGRPWIVGAGQHFLGGEPPLAWTPDTGPSGTHEVIATLCPEDGQAPSHCATAAFAVRWGP